MIRKQSRRAATLTEVLVAIFVMAIGLLALLTLFPLGALSMAQAIKDNRTAHSGKNAFAIAEAYNSGIAGTTGSGIHNDLFVTNSAAFLSNFTPPNSVAVFQGAPPIPGNATSYFLNPYPGFAQFQPGVAQPAGSNLAPDLAASSFDGPSYPIYVDPWGWNTVRSAPTGTAANPNGVAVPYWTVGGIPIPGTPPTANFPLGGLSAIPRLPVSGLATTPSANQWLTHWCTLSDDITFSEDGTPSTNTGAVQRENRYTWAWLMRRPKASDSTVVDTTVVVYSGRSLTTLGETVFINGINPNTGNATNFVWFDPDSKFVDIVYSGTKPSIRTGSWILDATMEFYNPAAQINIPDPHGFFYRVVGVTDVSNNVMRLELQTNPRKPSFYNTTDTGAYGVLIVMENVVEVFEKGPGWQP